MKHIKIMLAVLILGFQAQAQHQPFGQRVTPGQDIDIPSGIPINPPVIDQGPPPEDERYVFWLHGLNGDIGSWSDASAAVERNVAPGFPARRIKSVTDLPYTQSNGLEEAGAQIGREVERYAALQRAQGEDPTNNFLIGHSQGGMIMRALMNLDFCVDPRDPSELPYGGGVTYATPHGGALILNNKHMFGDMSEDLCKSLTAGPALLLADKGIKMKIFGFKFEVKLGKLIPVQELVFKFCERFSDVLVPLLSLEATPRITQDYEVGADYLEELTNGCENIDYRDLPKVSIYSDDRDPALMFRTLKYFAESANAPDYFKAGYDADVLVEMDKARQKYLNFMVEYQMQKERMEALYDSYECDDPRKRVFHWGECNFYERGIQKMDKYISAFNQGYTWFDRVDDQYKMVIGALEIERIKENWCSCYIEATGQTEEWKLSPGDICVHPGTKNCVTFTKTVFNRVEKGSDGVVLVESASNWPDATYSLKVNGSTHMQLRNDENTRSTLYDLLEGDYGDFFETEKR